MNFFYKLYYLLFIFYFFLKIKFIFIYKKLAYYLAKLVPEYIQIVLHALIIIMFRITNAIVLL